MSAENKWVKECVAAIERQTGVVPEYDRVGGSGHLIYRLGPVKLSISQTPSDKARALQNHVRTAKRLLRGVESRREKEYMEQCLATRHAKRYVAAELGVDPDTLPTDWGRKSVKAGHLKDCRPAKTSGGAGQLYLRHELDTLVERLRENPRHAAFFFDPPPPPPTPEPEPVSSAV